MDGQFASLDVEEIPTIAALRVSAKSGASAVDNEAAVSADVDVVWSQKVLVADGITEADSCEESTVQASK